MTFVLNVYIADKYHDTPGFKREVMQEDEAILLTELKTGSSAAFKYFYEKYRLQLYRKLLKMVQLEVIAEELLQDLFIKIWDKRSLIDPEQSFKAYLYRIAENMVFDYFRKLAREAKLELAVQLNSTEFINPIEEGIFEKETQSKINEAIALLPPQQKLVFTLCKIEGKSYKEVSDLLGISTGTINAHITSATKSIKAHLANGDGLTLLLLLSCAIRGGHM